MLQLFECLLLRFTPKEFLFRSSLGDLTQGSSDMRESQHEPVVEVGEAQETTELCLCLPGQSITNDLGYFLDPHTHHAHP